MRSFITTLVLILAASSLFPSVAAAAVFISGQVTQQGRPVAGATISLFQPDEEQPLGEFRTLTNGSFLLHAPSAGSYRLEIWQVGQSLDQEVDVPAAGISNVALRLDPPAVGDQSSGASVVTTIGAAPGAFESSTLQLRLLTPAGKPLQSGNAEIWFWLSWDPHGAEILPSIPSIPQDGILTLKPPSEAMLGERTMGMVEVRVAGVGCGRLRLHGWPREAVTLRLETGASLYGRVLYDASKPQAGKNVLLQRLFDQAQKVPDSTLITTTDSTGCYEFKNLLRDWYIVCTAQQDLGREIVLNVKPMRASLSPVNGAVRPTAMDTYSPGVTLTSITHRLDPNTFTSLPFVSGRVTLKESGAPLPDAVISLKDIWSHGKSVAEIAQVTAGPDGSFSFQAPEGLYQMEIKAKHCFPVVQPVNLSYEGLHGMTICLDDRPTLRICLVRPDGLPVSSGTMEVSTQMITKWYSDGGTMYGCHPSPGGLLDLHLFDEAMADPVTAVDFIVHGSDGSIGKAHVDGWPNAPVPMQMSPGRIIKGIATDATGKPLANVLIDASELIQVKGRPQIGGWSCTFSRTDGHYDLRCLLPGKYVVRAHLSGSRKAYKTIDVGREDGEANFSPADSSEPPPGIILGNVQ